MTDMMRATARPWRAEENGRAWRLTHNGNLVATINTRIVGQREYAEELARAANAHEALVEALEATARWFDNGAGHGSPRLSRAMSARIALRIWRRMLDGRPRMAPGGTGPQDARGVAGARTGRAGERRVRRGRAARAGDERMVGTRVRQGPGERAPCGHRGGREGAGDV